MSLTAQYDAFADIYEIWTATAPVTARNLPFYVDSCRETPGLVALAPWAWASQ